MNDLRRPGVLPFLLAEAVLYGTFLWRDLSPGGPGSTPVKYAALLSCALFSLLWALFGGGDRLTALALVLTVIVTQVPALALMFFGDVTLELRGVLWALLLAFLIIPINEAYKAIMRAVEKDQ